jgi:phosphatidylinositol-3,4,5-trisphosphate 3-phosphatase and dual-specificity protein phosphatase PTEN
MFDKNLLKSMVSKKKYRFEYEGFDLDLTYITERIIAMGFPANNLEKFYRNAMSEVQRFFDKRHNKHYKVYNLCSERVYPEDSFFEQAYYPFNDHEAPPINILIPFCKDVHDFLSKDPQNVVAIHCKAGKGRTGTMICAYLLYSGLFKTAEENLKFYGFMRTKNGKGVTIPSQIRYVYYFEHILKANINHEINGPTVLITKIKLHTVPKFSRGSKCTPYFKIENANSEYNYKKNNKLETYKNEAIIELKVNNFSALGDVKISFFNKSTIGKDKMFTFWFNTFFLPNDGVFMIKKSMLDKACKDKHNEIFEPNFKVEIQYIILDENFNVLDNNFLKDVGEEINGLKI